MFIKVSVTMYFIYFLGNRAFESVEFNSTVYVNSNTGQGTIGVVVGFQSAKVFYAIMWKKAYPDVGLVVKVRARSLSSQTPMTPHDNVLVLIHFFIFHRK